MSSLGVHARWPLETLVVALEEAVGAVVEAGGVVVAVVVGNTASWLEGGGVKQCPPEKSAGGAGEDAEAKR